jgi:hypothetical protein
MSILAPKAKGLPPLKPGGLGSGRSLGSRGSRTWPFFRHLDWLLVLAVLALCVFGTLLVWSATKPSRTSCGSASGWC